MHDRRIDGIPEVFGNAGSLFMSAMTWWDHSTRSIWSQPWGRSIQGERKGVELFLLPSQLAAWESWLEAYPETLVLKSDDAIPLTLRQRFDPEFVIGLVLAGQAKAYPYRLVEQMGVVNDWLGSFPVVVWAGEERFHAYLRQADGLELTFRLDGGELIDDQTGSHWDIARGLAVSGELRGTGLQGVPGSSAYDWAWADFYPESAWFAPE